ncbi:MAG: family 20 glycosylhydrolase [Clostridia bacterium]|nr:family 20 glycosylhydrolase [Clostridia bacterium]
MFTSETIARIQKTVWDLIGYTYKGSVSVNEGPGLRVAGDANAVTVTAQTLPALARAFFRMAQELSAGKTELNICETAQFESCGAFLDFSRNGVMTVDACKRYMDYLSALGMNLIVLYTEDTYTVPEYPYMGYLRGRYSQQELHELDEYALSLGMELVPCIQTLGHLEQMLQWKEHQHMKDQPTVIMCDEPDTYAFIEAEIRSIRQSISGRRLHIGMDEAHGVGLGRYFYKNGLTDRFELLSRHLQKVVELCQKYDFYPLMWSDMFFRLGSKTDAYYDLESDIPQSVIDSLPPVGMVYWDYYHTDDFWYEHMLTQHEKMSKDTIFAGGLWTWSGFLPQVDFTWATMEPGLRVCAKHQVKTVMATMWGDDGAETDHFLALSQLPMFSEFCWRADECTPELVKATGEFLTGLPKEAYEAFSLFYPGAVDRRTGKALVYCDLLYPLGPQGEELEKSIDRSRKALEILSPMNDSAMCRYAAALFDVCLQKAMLLREMRPRYLQGDKDWLAQTAEETIPALMEAYEILRDEHKALWESHYKRNGWEVLALRYGAVLGRLTDVQDVLLRYSEDELDAICELDEQPLDPTRKNGMQFYQVYVTPAYNL